MNRDAVIGSALTCLRERRYTRTAVDHHPAAGGGEWAVICMETSGSSLNSFDISELVRRRLNAEFCWTKCCYACPTLMHQGPPTFVSPVYIGIYLPIQHPDRNGTSYMTVTHAHLTNSTFQVR